MKNCKKCLIDKPLTEFYKLSSARQHLGDGHGAQCKECIKAFHRTPESRQKASIAYKSRYATPEGRAKEQAKNRKYRSTPNGKKKCAERSRKWAENNPERYKEITRKASAKQRQTEHYKISTNKSRTKNIHKHYARNTLYQAIKLGYIIKPTICEYCHVESYLEGHHHDYNQPLAVTWLCKTCHEKIHHNKSEAS